MEELQKLADNGDVDAIYQLATTYGVMASPLLNDGEANNIKAINLAKKGSDLGHAWSAMFLGSRLSNEDYSTFDAEAAFEAYQRSVDFDPEDGYTHFLIGKCFETGAGTSANLIKAIEFYCQAANLSNRDGMYALSRCYEEGIGVDKDAVVAESWCEKGDADFAKYNQ